MSKKLVTVEDAFRTTGSGVLVSPRFTPENAKRDPFPVRLRFPDGSERTTTARLEFAHIRGPLPPFAMLRLIELGPEDVAAGTEIWQDD